MRQPLSASICLRLLAMFWLLACSAITAHAQEASRCQPQILKIQVAKADAQGPIPDDQALDWSPVPKLNDYWRNRWPDYVGAAWYRIDWQQPCDKQPTALFLHSMIMAGEVYAGQDALWRDKYLSEPLSRSWNMPQYWLLPQTSLQAGTHQIWIRIHGRADDSAGLGPVYIGDPQKLMDLFEQAMWDHRTMLYISLMVALVMSVLFGFAWLQNRPQTTLGWYATTNMFWALLMASALTISAWPLPSSLAYARAGAVLFIGFATSYCIFVVRFGDLRLPRLERMLWVFSGTALALHVFAPVSWRTIAIAIATHAIHALLIVVISLWFPFHAWRTRKPEHLMFATCIPFVLLPGLHDLLSVNGLIGPSISLQPYSVPITTIALALVLGRQLALNIRRIEQFNVELTESVSRACDDLSLTLEREHSLALRHSLLQERMQISHDLHDSLGGSLVRSIAYVEQSRAPLPNTQVLSMLKLMRDDLRQMIDNGASITLQVPETPAQWIAPIRHRFSLLFEELELQASWVLPPIWITCPSPIQCLTLTRVLEEALTNVIKHSRARRVCVFLEQPSPKELTLRITDDGVGFDVHSTQANGMGVGMRSMQARVERINGTLTVESSTGTTVLLARLLLSERTGSSAETPSGSMPLQP